MLLTGTVVVLALWLGFVWFAGPDKFRKRACSAQEQRRPQSPRRRF